MSEPYDTFFIEIDHAAAPFPWLESLPFLQAHADRLGITIHWSYGRNLIIATPGGAKPQIIELSSTAEKNAQPQEATMPDLIRHDVHLAYVDGIATGTEFIPAHAGDWVRADLAIERIAELEADRSIRDAKADGERIERLIFELADLERDLSVARDVIPKRLKDKPLPKAISTLVVEGVVKGADLAKLKAVVPPRPLNEYHEDMGAVLWTRVPIEEAPWCGGLDDSDWPYDNQDFGMFFVPLPAAFSESWNDLAAIDDHGDGS